MQSKIKQSLKLRDSYIGSQVENKVNEEIRAKDARDDKKVLSSIIKGNTDVGFIELSKQIEPIIVKYDIGVIPIRMTSQNTMMAIIYTNRAKAFKLYEFAKRDNYLADKNPSEAREIGRLLGYPESDIEEYVNKKYGRKIPLRTDSPDDYDDLHESTLPTLNKKVIEVVKDEKGNDVKICTVNGEFVKGTNPGLGFIQFVEGGHHYVDSYPGYKENIPEDELWVDEVFYKTPENFHGIVGHEFKERNNMKYHKMSYDDAHDISNKAEKIFRGKKEKLNENFQFNKIKDLMKKII